MCRIWYLVSGPPVCSLGLDFGCVVQRRVEMSVGKRKRDGGDRKWDWGDGERGRLGKVDIKVEMRKGETTTEELC